ncbi:MAG TPA: CHAT domain-containing protein [Pyrinomonadaceae bacterium]
MHLMKYLQLSSFWRMASLSSRNSLRASLYSLSICALLLLAGPAATTRAQCRITPKQEGAPAGKAERLNDGGLAMGQPVERELASDHIHSYRMMLTAGQIVRAEVQQLGIGVALSLRGPNGIESRAADNPLLGEWGPEAILFPVETTGYYIIEVRPRKINVPPARYEIRLSWHRMTAEDKNSLLAESDFKEAGRFLSEKQVEPAIKKYEDAYQRYRRDYQSHNCKLTYTGQVNACAEAYRGQVITLTTLGYVLHSLGMEAESLSYLKRAGELQDQSQDLFGKALTLSITGQVEFSRGEYEKALEAFNKALSLFQDQKVNDSRMAAYTFNYLGLVNDGMGETEAALKYYNEALSLFQRLGELRGQAYTLNNIGLLYDAMSRHKEAREYKQKAMAIFEEIGDCLELAPALSNNALDALNSGDKKLAFEYLNRALALQRAIQDRQGEAKTLNNLGYLYKETGQIDKALQFMNEALLIHREVQIKEAELIGGLLPDRRGEGDTLANLMSTWKMLKKPFIAIYYGKSAVNAFQDVRAQFSSHGKIDKEAQKSFIQSREVIYHDLADLLIETNQISLAIEVLGLLKEDEYYEFTRRDGDTAANGKLPVSEAEKSIEEREKMIAANARRRNELMRKGSAQRTPGEEQELAMLDARLRDEDQKIQDQLRKISGEIAGPNQTGSRETELENSLKKMQRVLELFPQKVAAVYTFVLNDSYSVVFVTPDSIPKSYSVPIKREELNKKVIALYEDLRDPRSQPLENSQALYKIIVGPIEKDLQRYQPQTLMWSLDGYLRLIPVAALHDGRSYMAERYSNAIFTLKTDPERLKEAPAQSWKGLGSGVSQATDNFPELRFVPQELHKIIHDVEAAQHSEGLLPGNIILDDDFTKEVLDKYLRQKRPNLVHIASHFEFKPGTETHSFLLLGKRERFTLDQLRNEPDYFEGVHLLALSACNTATGEGMTDKEVEGFAVSAQREGAGAVLASLWSVSDESTSLLMEQFYRNLSGSPRATKAEALSRAQAAMLQGALKGPNGKTYAHPYYWAPFILIGNWR